MVSDSVRKALENAVTAAGYSVPEKGIPLSHPEIATHGDFATNVAFMLAKDAKKAPFQVAEEIAAKIEPGDMIETAEAVKPGFVNITLTANTLARIVSDCRNGRFDYAPFHFGPHKKLMVEFAHPNTLKLLHIGHLRNLVTGETLVRLLEATGNEVVRANYQGDVGMHIAKTLWHIKTIRDREGGLGRLRNAAVHEKIAQIGKSYVAGNAAFESDEASKAEIVEINRKIYNKSDEDITTLWAETRQWSLDYFDTIYERVGTRFDYLYFESEMADRGVELCKKALETGILIEDDGAIIIPGEKYGVDRRVFVNRLGLPTYEGKEVALGEQEFKNHGQLDRCIHLVTAEQSSFFKAVFVVHELLGLAPKGAQFHLPYGWVDVKGAKMSSRKGNVIEGEWLLDEAKKAILAQYENTADTVAETLAVAAVKYAFLKNALNTKVNFDLEEAITLTGNSGPYLVYSYVRTRSLLGKDAGAIATPTGVTSDYTPTEEERAIQKTLLRFPTAVHEAARTFAPNLVANVLYQLAQEYNLFYQNHPILKAEQPERTFRLYLTAAVSNVLKEGLTVLGIPTVEKM
jgi:arginyl-tRNA synthetase